MTEERALRTQKLHRAAGCASEIFDAAGQRDEPRGDDRAGEFGDVRRQVADRSLDVGLDRPPLAHHEFRQAGERLQFGFLPLRQIRSDALPSVDGHPIPSPVDRYELDVRRGVHHRCQLREVKPVPFPESFDKNVLFFLKFVEGADRLPEMILGSDRLAHSSLCELDHRPVQELASVAEVLRLRNGGRTVVRLPPARSNRGSMTKTSSARAMRSRSSSRTFQSSTKARRSARALASIGKSLLSTTVPSSSKKEPNHVVKRSMARGERGRSVKAYPPIETWGALSSSARPSRKTGVERVLGSPAR